MASVDESQRTIQIAGTGHVYIAESDTPLPDLGAYTFGDGTTLETKGWYWLGDTSSENVVNFESDGGDTTTLATWDRPNVDSTRDAVTTKVSINSVAMTGQTVEVAFPGSVQDPATGGYDLQIGGTVEKSVLILVEDAQGVSGIQLRRVSLGGTLPTLDREKFTEIPISGTLLTPVSGKTAVHWVPRRAKSGASTAAPTIASIAPTSASAGTTVTITGTNFTGTYAVTFGGRFGTFTVVSATKLKATVPSSAGTGSVKVVVRNGAGSAESNITLT